jgi:WD40 repeat protein
LDGRVDLISFSVKCPSKQQEAAATFSFVLLAQVYAHNWPITNMIFSHSSDYLLTTSQDCLLKLVKINKSIIENEPTGAQAALQQSEQIMHVIYELSTRRIMNDLSPVTSMCIYDNSVRNELVGASGYANGAVCVWNFLSGECEFKLRTHDAKSIIKIEIADELLVSLSADHQMCIWNRHRGRLIKELKFIAPLFAKPSSLLLNSDGEPGQTESYNFNLFTAVFFLASRLMKTLLSSRRYVIKTSSAALSVSSSGTDMMHIAPTMCLYSKNILAMGGCACIFFWNIQSGELVKKVNINKERLGRSVASESPKSERSFFSEASYIKEIRLVRQRDTPGGPNGKPSKLLIASDYNDSIYVLKIPANIF